MEKLLCSQQGCQGTVLLGHLPVSRTGLQGCPGSARETFPWRFSLPTPRGALNGDYSFTPSSAASSCKRGDPPLILNSVFFFLTPGLSSLTAQEMHCLVASEFMKSENKNLCHSLLWGSRTCHCCTQAPVPLDEQAAEK